MIKKKRTSTARTVDVRQKRNAHDPHHNTNYARSDQKCKIIGKERG